MGPILRGVHPCCKGNLFSSSLCFHNGIFRGNVGRIGCSGEGREKGREKNLRYIYVGVANMFDESNNLESEITSYEIDEKRILFSNPATIEHPP